MFEKILIANRGEIAMRIMRTVKKMGIKSVAVYSEADTNSLHVQFADEAVFIGQSPATESYLSIENILNAVRLSGAQAVHPGYGFLSENSLFASALRDEGVALIGPSVDSIKSMGDKIEAKKIAQEAGVSTVPGYMGIIKSASQAVEIANKIGFPVMIKAAAGGGGRGMRVVASESEIFEAFRSASSEAKNSFSDGRVFIEKFIEKPRHIEIQLIADKFGNAVCVGERECSIQRHHQKVIEEAPSIIIDQETREKMYSQVKALSDKVGYYSAGTVEFIVDPDKNFYFLEMNTRLQVEHCVTELITGIDLVEQMIKVAYNMKLDFTQEDIKLNGWAIESRIYAEDPARGFLPSSGRITEYSEPARSPNVRVDSGVDAGSEVSMFYDAMVAKLCTYGETRMEAITHMQNALGEFVIKGISHNISFLEAIMENPRFMVGDISTNFISEEYPDGFLGAQLTSDISQIFLAIGLFVHMREAQRMAEIAGHIPGRERQIGTRWVIKIDGVSYTALIKPTSGGYNIRQERQRIHVRSNWVIGHRLFRGVVNDKAVTVKIDNEGSAYLLTHAGRSSKIVIRSPRVAELERHMPVKSHLERNNILIAPLSGYLAAIKVKEGDKVKIGQELVVIEAMKMENILYAEQEATVASIHSKQGENVSSGEIILEFA